MSKDEAAETMRKHKLHHLLVTDDEGKFYGLISSYDIARETLWTRKRGQPRPETHQDFIHVSGPSKSIGRGKRLDKRSGELLVVRSTKSECIQRQRIESFGVLYFSIVTTAVC